MKYGLPLAIIEKLLSRKENRTSFELSKNIYNSGFKLLKDYDSLKFYTKQKTDGTNTLTLVYRANISEDKDCWLMWDITKEQLDILFLDLKNLYEEINGMNNMRRTK